MKLNIQNKFTTALPADPITENHTRQVTQACFSYVTPLIPSSPSVLHVAQEVAQIIGLTEADTQTNTFRAIFSGERIAENSQPFAMCYGGHQFGNWAGQLGDGRAINLFEVEHNQQRLMLQLKGAGPTPYSRSGDGFAVLRSSIREHLCSEAMHNLGVATTRSLALLASGDDVIRDMLYDGNPAYEKGAIVCRVAPSFIRFGNFEILASRKDFENLANLADYTLQEYYPEITAEGPSKYIEFFKTVAHRTRAMIVDWQRVGFVHGVMNTDNMSIHGITIDYGPYGWLEDYNPDWTPNTTDNQSKRYRFSNQPLVAQWNLFQLANALYPLVQETEPFETIIHDFIIDYKHDYVRMMLQKLGLTESTEQTSLLIEQLVALLPAIETDMTIFFRNLSNVQQTDTASEAMLKIEDAFYNRELLSGTVLEQWITWFNQYLQQLQSQSVSDITRKTAMDAVNPKYVLRNYMVQLAIDDANEGHYDKLNELYHMLLKPYDEQPNYAHWFAKRPDWARDKVGCSALSCSS